MKTRIQFTMLCFMLGVSMNYQAFACSSFAAYADKPVFGMNFDYEKFPMKLLIEDSGDIRTFHLAFQRPLGDKMIWARTGGMNSNGLFAAVQEEYPYKRNLPVPGKNKIFIYELYNYLSSSANVFPVESMCKQKKLLQLQSVSVHCLFADIAGNAIITEAGDTNNQLLKIKDRFIVMTNFPNRSLKGKTYKDAKGIGDKRYITGYDYIQKNIDTFDNEKGMKVLELMKNRNLDYPTSCSMVFDPAQNHIYVALFANYQKIFRVSLKEKTISTFKGFNQFQSFKLGSKGVLISTLNKLN